MITLAFFDRVFKGRVSDQGMAISLGDTRLLPDFSAPPLDEVVVGAQFATPPQYNTLYARSVWDLYREEFPEVVEQPRLPPQFEVFGGNPQPGFQIEFGPPQLRNRLWFISKDDSHLLQFQDDRLLLNWRNRTNGTAYPRHERIQSTFTEYLERLEGLYLKEFKQGLLINQAEVSYINIIPLEDFSAIGDWLRIGSPPELKLEGLNAVFGEIVRDEHGKPIARLSYEMQSVTTSDGKQKALRLSLTVRGAPLRDNIGSAMAFISLGRDKIVNRFCDITTESAQRAWGRRA